MCPGNCPKEVSNFCWLIWYIAYYRLLKNLWSLFSCFWCFLVPNNACTFVQGLIHPVPFFLIFKFWFVLIYVYTFRSPPKIPRQSSSLSKNFSDVASENETLVFDLSDVDREEQVRNFGKFKKKSGERKKNVNLGLAVTQAKFHKI